MPIREDMPAPTAEEQGDGTRARAELTTAETAECQCPDFCERDHELD
jgi:hypothetical protein